MSLISYKRGQGSIVLRVKILNSAATNGSGLTGLTNASSGLIIAAIADNEATTTAYTVAGSNVETISTLGTYAAPTSGKCRFKEVDSTNHKGVYEIHLADARYAVSGAKSLLVSISGATNAAETDVVIPLQDLDPYDAVRAGLTALPNVASGNPGAVITAGTGTAQLNVSAGAVVATTTTTNLTNLPAITTDWITSAGVSAAAVTKIQSGLATPTNITAGTITTVTNLTNAPTSGDFTATMKASITTAATASTPTVSVGSGGITSGSFGSGAITASAIAADAFTAAKFAADVTTELQSGLATASALATVDSVVDSIKLVTDNLPDAGALTSLATAANLATVAGYLDTEVAAILADTSELQTDWTNGGRLDLLIDAIKAVADKLDDTVEDDGGTYRFTTNALEQAPGGGSGTTDWTADERTAIRSILGIPGSGTTPADPTSGILDTIRDYMDTEIAAIKAKTDNLPSDPADASDIASSFSTVNGTLATISGYLDTEVAAILAAVDTEVAAIKAKTDNLPASPAAVGDIPSAAAIADAVWAEAMTELSGVPGVTASVLEALTWCFTLARNKLTQTSTTGTLYKGDGTTALATSTVSDSGGTFTRGEFS